MALLVGTCLGGETKKEKNDNHKDVKNEGEENKTEKFKAETMETNKRRLRPRGNGGRRRRKRDDEGGG